MTQKHFIAIAKLIRQRRELEIHYQAKTVPGSTSDHGHESALSTLKDMAEDMADYFATINANFKRDKFLAACGLGD